MQPPEQSFEEAVLERVCAVCAERRDDGSCGIDANLECAIKKHLPSMIESVEGSNSKGLAGYVAPIRTGLCSVCNEDTAGSCDVRERSDCPLDRYLSLVIHAIEDVSCQRPAT